VPVRRLRPGDLAGQSRHGHFALRPGLEVAKLDVAMGELVPEDHGEVRVLPGRLLELATETPHSEVRPGGQAR
jgi:hypothetical protein